MARPASTSSSGSNFASIFSALGNVFEGGNLVPFAAGGVVTRPVQFPLARGVGIMGKAGPGAIMPLDRVGGRLGVNASGMGVNVTVIDQRSGGAPPQVTEGRGPDGRKAIRILIRDEVREYLSDGGGDRTLSSAFGLRRRGVSR
jgi:phage-related minor tail protein